MELLYLYIEEFKSIEQQEFLLTPDFDISYKANKLEINKKESGLPDNFFGERIGNIHAIIGQNGSGKSSLLEFIVTHTSNSKFAWKDKAIFIFRDKGKLYILKHKSIRVNGIAKFKKEHTVCIFKEGNFTEGSNPLGGLYTVYYSNYYDGELKDFQDQQLENLADISTNFIQRLRERFDYSFYRQEENIETNSFESKSSDLEDNLEGYSFRAFEVDKQIDLISSRSHEEVLGFPIPDTIEVSFYPHHDARQMISQFKKDDYYSPTLDSQLAEFDLLFDDTALHKFIKAIVYCKSITHLRRFTPSISYQNVLSKIQIVLDQPKSEFDIEKIMDSFAFTTSKKQLRELISQLRKLDNYSSSHGTYIIPTTEDELKLVSKLNGAASRAFYSSDNPIKFDWYFKNSNRSGGLSSGEKAMLSFYARVHYASDIYMNSDTLFIIDEGDLGLHPEWQRTFIQKLVSQGSIIARPGTPPGKPIQVLITSHSPFLASDLPDSNITYLKRNEDNRCEVVDSERGHNSFAANINVLLHDKYFLSGGFLSEFAKRKVVSIIDSLKYYRNVKENKDKKTLSDSVLTQAETKQIIDLIGEPVLHERLLEEYLSVFGPESRLSNKQKIKELESQIRKLKEES